MKNFRIYLLEKVFYYVDIKAETEAEAEDKAATLIDSATMFDKVEHINYVEGPEILRDAVNVPATLARIRADLESLIDSTNTIENNTAHASPEQRDAVRRGNAYRAALKALEEDDRPNFSLTPPERDAWDKPADWDGSKPLA